MKIQLEQNDIAKVLKTFLPQLQYADGTISFQYESASGDDKDAPAVTKCVELENADLALSGRIRYDQNLSGDLKLNLDRNGINAELKLD